MQIDANAMRLRLENIITSLIDELGGGGEIENIGYTFNNVDHKTDKTKNQLTAIITGEIKKTFEEEPITPTPPYTLVPLTFSVSVSSVIQDLTPPIVP
jgi:hypothetical protein